MGAFQQGGITNYGFQEYTHAEIKLTDVQSTVN